MPRFGSRRRKAEAESKSTTAVTTTDRVRAAVRILLVVMLAVRLVRAVRRLPADITLLRTEAASPA
jgi:hypothetical protein